MQDGDLRKGNKHFDFLAYQKTAVLVAAGGGGGGAGTYNQLVSCQHGVDQVSGRQLIPHLLSDFTISKVTP
jgi:hypothetical protein